MYLHYPQLGNALCKPCGPERTHKCQRQFPLSTDRISRRNFPNSYSFQWIFPLTYARTGTTLGMFSNNSHVKGQASRTRYGVPSTGLSSSEAFPTSRTFRGDPHFPGTTVQLPEVEFWFWSIGFDSSINPKVSRLIRKHHAPNEPWLLREIEVIGDVEGQAPE